jgi:hypothetical protein
MAYNSHNVNREFSSQITDLAVNSGEYDPLTDNRETTYINKNGKVVSEKTPYGIKPEN